ncbi:hypothetical protein ON010_g5625 [Phytophthora cinnamomi]|nr:hypothetical protein ON010_g5625 [Phytophthora cinnamomi]
MVLANVRAGGALVGAAVRSGTAAFSTAGRLTFEELTAGADAEQLEFMKEQIVQVDEQDNIVGPISKKDGELEDGFGVKRAAIRKLEHELGIPTSTFALEDLAYVSTVMYKAASDANWTECEMDHILFARGDVPLNNVNENEVEQVEFIARENLPALLDDSTRKLSPWFHLIGSNLLPHWWDNLDMVLAQDNADRQIHDYR